jgi:hypothetical protein
LFYGIVCMCVILYNIGHMYAQVCLSLHDAMQYN